MSQYKIVCYETHIFGDFGAEAETGFWWCVDIQDTHKVLREYPNGEKLYDHYTMYRSKNRQYAELTATGVARFFGVALEETILFDR